MPIQNKGYTLYSPDSQGADEILKDYFPESYGDQRLLAYPIGQFVSNLNQMWDTGEQGVIKEFLGLNDDDSEAIYVSTCSAFLNKLYQTLAAVGVAPKRNFNIYPAKRESIVREVLKSHRSQYEKHRFQNLEPKFWIDEFTWMKDMNVWLDNREFYLTLPRTGRGRQVLMNSADRETAYQPFYPLLPTAGTGPYGGLAGSGSLSRPA